MSEIFRLPDGTEVGTGNLQSTPEDLAALSTQYKVFGEDFYLEKSDIEALLKDDVYKHHRTLHQKRMMNQARLSKCNASASIGALHQIRANAGLPDVVLSDCDLYMRINGGRDAGSQLKDGFHALEKEGVAPRKLEFAGKSYVIPSDVYRQRDLPREWAEVAAKTRSQFKTFEPFLLPSTNNYEDFKIAVASAIARRYPIVFACHVGAAFMRLNNGYAVNGNGVGNHAVFAHSGRYVGGKDIVHPDKQGSWGPVADEAYGPRGGGWGDGGFGLFTMESFARCRSYHAYWVLVSTTQEDASDPLGTAV